MNNILSIRRYQPEDIEAVKTLHYAGVRQIDAYAGTDSELFGVDFDLDADLDDIENVYLRNNGEFLVGIYEEKLVAMGALKRQSETRAEIKRMRVYQEYQRRGFGQIILQKLTEAAVLMGYTELCLDTLLQNIPAQILYEKKGFIRTGQKRIGRFDVVFYEKLLTH